MPPRLPLLGRQTPLSLLNPTTAAAAPTTRPAICLLCSLARAPPSPTPLRSQPRRAARFDHHRRAINSTAAAASATPPPPPPPQQQPDRSPAAPRKTFSGPREALADALVNLQKEAAPYINLSRLRLALQNLQQEPGEESVRIAILALGNLRTERAGASADAAKKLLKVLLADPLSSVASEETWEGELEAHDLGASPLVVSIRRRDRGSEAEQKGLGTVEFDIQTPESTCQGQDSSSSSSSSAPLLYELLVDSPEWNGHNVEILVMESNRVAGAKEDEFAGNVLVPMLEMQFAEERYSGVTTPVHKTLVVGQGFEGAATVSLLPPHDGNVIVPVANIPELRPDRNVKEAGATRRKGYHVVDLRLAEKALHVFRESLSNAMEYERLWFDANMPEVVDRVRHGVLTKDDGRTKGVVRDLIASLLADAELKLENEKIRRSKLAETRREHGISATTRLGLEDALTDWAEQAHLELQDSLDAAFEGARWRRLGWWKLFWRVDDVGMVAGDVIGRYFLGNAESSVIYLAGRMDEAGIFEGAEKKGYIAPKLFTGEVEQPVKARKSPRGEESGSGENKEQQELVDEEGKGEKKYTVYPTDISHTRSYLVVRTVPALQALAQKLVLQTASTIGTTGALGGLLYLSEFSIESAVAVALFGAVWSSRRMQQKWETARKFWEGGVREEGRKAVRKVEASVMEAMDRGVKEDMGMRERDAAGFKEVEVVLKKTRAVLEELK